MKNLKAMNGIKFRGKPIDEERGKWVYGYLIEDSKKSYIFRGGFYKNSSIKFIKELNDDTYLVSNLVEVHPWSIGQYANRPDCYGNEIYEGDIVLNATTDNRGDFWARVSIQGGCYYTYKDLRCDMKDLKVYYEMHEMKLHSYKVIGNIHDNPELLSKV